MEFAEASQANLAPPGSPEYFALLFAGPAVRADLRSLLMLEKHLEDLSLRPMDSDVRNAKLGWWAGELERLAQGQAVHPVARDTYRILQSHGLDSQPFLVLFAAVMQEVASQLPETPQQLLEHAASRSAVVSVLAARLMTGRVQPGASCSFTELARARFLTGRLAAGHACQSDSMAGPSESQARSAGMLAELARRQRSALHAELEGLTVHVRQACTPLLVMAGEINHRLGELAEARSTVRQSQLASLWRAWRNARRASRGQLPK